MTEAYLYKWTETTTAKWYVGSRTAKNCHPADGYLCSSKVVKPKILENPNDWVREILVIGPPIYIRELESEYLQSLSAAQDDMSYNMNNGDGKFHTIGLSPSAETRKKMSIASKDMIFTDSHKAKISAAKKGKSFSESHIDKLRESHLGNTHTDEVKAKISAGLLGHEVSDETRNKIRNANKGKKRTTAEKQKMSDAHKGVPWSAKRRATFEKNKESK